MVPRPRVFGNRRLEALKNLVGVGLRRSPRVYRAASRLLYTFDRSFRTLSPGAPRAVERAIHIALDRQGDAMGDYYEFGVFRGYLLWHAQKTLEQERLPDVRYWGFDSFQGLPPITDIDREAGLFHEGQFACTLATVKRHLSEHGADLGKVKLIKGFFADALTSELRASEAMRHIGVAVIDCDLYASTVDVLRWLPSLLADGAVLVFDDWYAFGRDDLGQPRAFEEFLERHPGWRAHHLFDFPDHGRVFQMARRG